MLIKSIAYVLFCLVAGGAISAGYVAFITLLGVFDKLSEKLKAVKHSYVIETLIIIGVTIGNFAYLLQLKLPFGLAGYVFFELMGGVFIGCLAGALAETIDTFKKIFNQEKSSLCTYCSSFGKGGRLVNPAPAAIV